MDIPAELLRHHDHNHNHDVLALQWRHVLLDLLHRHNVLDSAVRFMHVHDNQ